MTDQVLLRQLRNVAIVALLIVILVAAASVLRLIALAVLLSFILAPLANWLERRGLPRVASSVLTIFLALAVTGGLGWVVVGQVGSLAEELPRYEGNILKKVESIRALSKSPLNKVTEVAEHVQEQLEPTAPASQVAVVERAGPMDRIAEFVEPAAHWGENTFIVLFLVLLILLERETLGQRLIKLGGRGHVSITTKTLSQIGARLSRYLATFSLVNLATGIFVWLGMWLIGLPYAVLWGVLGAVLRYIPFVGPTLAFALPVIFSIAHFENLHQPALVIGWYLIIEIVTNVLEPYLYGKSTGISAVGLFVSAILWTWMWGPLGLLMATPLTVCLVVLGKSVPSMSVLATLLSDDVAISLDERLYQRVMRKESDEAIALLEDQCASTPLATIFDTAIMPMLARARKDVEIGVLEIEEWEAMEAILGDWVAEVSARPEILEQLQPPGELAEVIGGMTPKLIGVATTAGPDDFALRMLNALLRPTRVQAVIIDPHESPLVLGETIAEERPDCVILSHLPWDGLTRVRYLTKRLQATIGNTPLVIGIWDPTLDRVKVVDTIRPTSNGRVALSLTTARELILERLRELAAAQPEGEVVTRA